MRSINTALTDGKCCPVRHTRPALCLHVNPEIHNRAVTEDFEQSESESDITKYDQLSEMSLTDDDQY